MSPSFRYYVATSLDGYIATSDGGVRWLEPFNGADTGYDAFIETIGAVVMGRTTYEQVRAHGAWPYGKRPALVVTSRPLGDAPPGVKAAAPRGLRQALAELLPHVDGDVWIVGGMKTLAACRAVGALDRLEITVMPILLGAGVPLFPRFEGAQPLTLVDVRTIGRGMVHLVYDVAGAQRQRAMRLERENLAEEALFEGAGPDGDLFER